MNLNRKSTVCALLAALLVVSAGCSSNKGKELAKLPLSSEKVSANTASAVVTDTAVGSEATTPVDGDLSAPVDAIVTTATDANGGIAITTEPDIIPEDDVLPPNPVGETVTDNVVDFDMQGAINGCNAIASLPVYTFATSQGTTSIIISKNDAGVTAFYAKDADTVTLHYTWDATGNVTYFDYDRKITVAPYTFGDLQISTDSSMLKATDFTSIPDTAEIVELNGEQLYRCTAMLNSLPAYVYFQPNGLLRSVYSATETGEGTLTMFSFSQAAVDQIFVLPADFTTMTTEEYTAALSGGAVTNITPAETVASEPASEPAAELPTVAADNLFGNVSGGVSGNFTGFSG